MQRNQRSLPAPYQSGSFEESSPALYRPPPVQDNLPPTPEDVVIAVMGVTGSGKTTFIQQFCNQNLNIGHGLESCTHKVDVVPCIMPNGQRIFLIDTPGFDDTYRSDTDILGEIADWLAQSYQFKIRLTGIIYLHRITDVRVGGQGMKNLRMFRKVCGEKNLGSVVLATTMWSSCPLSDANLRESQLTGNSDLWKFLITKGARIFRHDRGEESGQEILDHLLTRGRKVILDIQHEVVDEGKKLVDTNAGREVQAEIEKIKEAHKKEMQEIREDMEEAIRSKDTERQEELRRYKAEVNKQMQAAQNEARQLELSREQLRKQMKEEHSREMAELRSEVKRRQQELERTSRLDAAKYDMLQKELAAMRDKEGRYRMKEAHRYKYKYRCPGCRDMILFNTRQKTLNCTTARCELTSDVAGCEMDYSSDSNSDSD
ncbi:hypothetical protein VTL71DRAFT_1099 [Oculimacula yallundae]|uniref:G domain-containing protein n=1 Tax=Oculimacula yallundae TaxID=86028 RepID=A0ABR4D465_9HELO